MKVKQGKIVKKNNLSILTLVTMLVLQQQCIKNTIHMAAKDGILKHVKKFVKEGIDINLKDDNGRTPLHHASYYAKLDVVQYLLSNGANIQAIDNEGISPLHLVADCWHFSENQLRETTCINMTKLLLSHKAKTNYRSKFSWLPLHVAIFRGNTKLIPLLAKGVNIKLRTDRNMTLLHLAVAGNNLLTVKKVCNLKVDQNARDNEGWTALHMAARKNYINIAKVLVACNVKKSIKNKEGLTAVELALSKGKEGFAAVISKYNRLK